MGEKSGRNERAAGRVEGIMWDFDAGASAAKVALIDQRGYDSAPRAARMLQVRWIVCVANAVAGGPPRSVGEASMPIRKPGPDHA
jgi:hypothetical protein